MEVDSESSPYSRHDDYEREEAECNELAEQLFRTAMRSVISFLDREVHHTTKSSSRPNKLAISGEDLGERVMELVDDAWMVATTKLRRRIRHLQRESLSVQRRSIESTQVSPIMSPSICSVEESPDRVQEEQANSAHSSKRASKQKKRTRALSDSEGSSGLEYLEPWECPYKNHTSLLRGHSCPGTFSGRSAVRDYTISAPPFRRISANTARGGTTIARIRTNIKTSASSYLPEHAKCLKLLKMRKRIWFCCWAGEYPEMIWIWYFKVSAGVKLQMIAAAEASLLGLLPRLNVSNAMVPVIILHRSLLIHVGPNQSRAGILRYLLGTGVQHLPLGGLRMATLT
ncbi:hypothetical protein BJ508DRAFT_49667 [Ascobolus immersus RN42]|uniref:Uncharacterized protein n=1 Tax=Ascobolus immersus RN42 TaxID=1160509 RepID=A0A3N4HHL7_ASCIM|nr:hypothetical protein BJ508DRAFT_49667 [Ascobolus immersus RN42]